MVCGWGGLVKIFFIHPLTERMPVSPFPPRNTQLSPIDNDKMTNGNPYHHVGGGLDPVQEREHLRDDAALHLLWVV
jgi:hypothetical protein